MQRRAADLSEANPMLGHRGCRLGVSYPEIYEMQARAIFEAAIAVAKETGGKFFLAEDAKSLSNIYKEIDTLERSEIESVRFMDYRELFAPFAILALLLVAIETGLNCTIFRKIP